MKDLDVKQYVPSKGAEMVHCVKSNEKSNTVNTHLREHTSHPLMTGPSLRILPSPPLPLMTAFFNEISWITRYCLRKYAQNPLLFNPNRLDPLPPLLNYGSVIKG